MSQSMISSLPSKGEQNENERVIHRIAETFNSGNLEQLDDLLGPKLSDCKNSLKISRAAFPNAHFIIENVFSSGHKVVERYTISGTHENPFLGISPTQKHVTISGISIVVYLVAR
jgi:predicted ester cyclase